MRYKQLKYFILISIIFFPFFVFAYDDRTTHPGLTREAVSLYNRYKILKLDDKQTEYIIQGSIDEDNPVTRSLNHFYDPVRSIGVLDYRDAIDWALGNRAESNEYSWSKNIKYYAEGDEEKAFYGLGHIVHLIEDMTVPEHTRNDPHMGDNFTNTSPYEDWASKSKNEKTLSGLSKNLKINDFKSVKDVFLFLSQYTNANYFSQDTIENKVYQYNKPVIEEVKGFYGFHKDELFGEKKLLILKNDKNGSKIKLIVDADDTSVLSEYFDRLGPIAISASASIIDLFMKEAIEARGKYITEQKLKQEEELKKAIELSEKLSKKSTVGLVVYGMSSAVGDLAKSASSKVGNLASSFSSGVKGVAEDTVVLARTGSFTSSLAASVVAEKANSLATKIGETVSNLDRASFGAFIISPPVSKNNTSSNQIALKTTTTLQPKNILNQNPNSNKNNDFISNQNSQRTFSNNYVPTEIQTLKDYDPGFGAGGYGKGGSNSNTESVASVEKKDDPPETNPNILPPIVFRPQNGTEIKVDKIEFEGSSTPNMLISAEFLNGDIFATTTSGIDGFWNFSSPVVNGDYLLNFFAVDFSSTTNRSLPTKLVFLVNLLLPEADLKVKECDDSLSEDSCLVLKKNLNLSWSSDSPNIDYFSLNLNGVLSTTTATSTTVSSLNNAVYTFSVVAVNKDGIKSNEVSRAVEVNSMPIVISEIDWDGTPNSASDEWLEIRNMTNSKINLNGFTLRSEDGSPYINLVGDMAPQSYYLIERKNTGENDEVTQSPIQNEIADMWVSFGSGLKNDGEHLLIDYKKGENATTTVFDVPFCDSWCGQGVGTNRTASLEWVNFITNDTPFGYWRTALPIGKGKDKAGNILTATPKMKNSTDYLINFGSNRIEKDMILSGVGGPYLIPPELPTTVSKGVTLTIGPGAVIKTFNRGAFNVYGHLVVNGTSESPVVFTSLYDDEYGGDFNNDGLGRLPAGGDWQGVRIFGQEATSTVNYAVFRYGGLKYPGSVYPATNLYTEEAPIVVSNSIFEYGYTSGANISNVSTSATLTNNTFRNTTKESDAYGLLVSATGAVIEGNRINGNGRGLGISAINGGSIKNNIIENNTGVAVYMGYLMAGFNIEGNIGSGNGTDSIQMVGDLSAPGVATILGKNSLPYQNMGLNVPANSTVTFQSGAVMKSGGEVAFTVNGNLEILGAPGVPVVFTSVEDDSDGVDITHNGEVVPSAGSLSTIRFSNAISKIENAVFKYFSKAVEYINSPIDLENVVFENNSVALVADPLEKIIRANNISFLGPGAGSTIPLSP